MIIKRLTMHNFGIYAGTNTFEFTHEKPVVLIGGMNGRGKTTFLNAVLLALYGENSIAYKESQYRSFGQYLRAYVNKNDQTNSSYIELELIVTDTTPETYIVHRSWNALTKRTKEEINVKRDGLVDSFLTENWALFVENIMPSALSGFYFFDGEKIAVLAADDTDVQMKESIRSMLGLSILDVLKNDLLRSQRRIGKQVTDIQTRKQIQELRFEKDAVIKQLSEIDGQVEALQKEIEEKQRDIDQLYRKHKAKGGDIVAQRNDLFQKRSEIQADLAHVNDELVLAASTVLPLTLVKDLIQKIKLQAEDEYNDLVLRESTEQIEMLFDDFVSQNTVSSSQGKAFIKYLKDRTASGQEPPIYELSNHALFQANNLIEHELDDSIGSMKSLLTKKTQQTKRLDELDSYLSFDINEKELTEISFQIKCKQKEEMDLRVHLSSLEKERAKVNSLVISKTAEFNRNVEEYLENAEMKDDASRMMKYSNIALNIIDEYSIELQKRKTSLLAETITSCYKKLANKRNMIHTIIMDAATLEMSYLDGHGNTVDKNSLSAGEKQLMVISILWALAICSKKQFPVIIDTPLSRLDSLHRTSLITIYFPEASEQTIILSTDSEINNDYYGLMKDYVGDEFTLKYDENTMSTTINHGYFREVQ